MFPCAIGRSFYEQVLPPESVHLGWSSNAAMWLRRIPTVIPGHFWSGRSTGAVRAAFERQAAQDWEMFLSLRAREMKLGARMVIVLPTVPNEQASGIAELMDHANAVLEDMVDEGAIGADERAGMVLGSHPRQKDELLARFAKEGHFQELVLGITASPRFPMRLGLSIGEVAKRKRSRRRRRSSSAPLSCPRSPPRSHACATATVKRYALSPTGCRMA